ncbi:Flp pilus assembly protein CpaB [Candidatus Liberibacter asiaticus]
MKLTRLMGIVVSGVFALVAGIIAMRLVSPHHVQTEEVITENPAKFINVLISKGDLAVGMVVTPNILEWVAFPEENVFDGFIDDVHQPNAMQELDGVLVRVPILKGDPIRLEKLVDRGNGGLSSLLPKGKRAATMDISISSAVGGMIKPNDNVDVVMVRSLSERKPTVTVVLSNIRVIAIDHNIDSDERVLVGSTATLELTPMQAKALVAAQSVAKLSLVLRSIADLNPSSSEDSDVWDVQEEGKEIQIIKAGVIVNKDGEGIS